MRQNAFGCTYLLPLLALQLFASFPFSSSFLSVLLLLPYLIWLLIVNLKAEEPDNEDITGADKHGNKPLQVIMQISLHLCSSLASSAYQSSGQRSLVRCDPEIMSWSNLLRN